MTGIPPRPSDVEWNALSTAWLSSTSAPPDPALLRARVAAQNRRIRLWQVAEILVTLAALGWSWSALHRGSHGTGWVIAIDTWAVVVIAWVFVWFGRDARRRPASDTTESYRRKARIRALQRRRVAWLAIFLVGAQWVVVYVAHLGATQVSIAFTALWLIWAKRERRAVQREIQWLDAFELDVAEPPQGISKAP